MGRKSGSPSFFKVLIKDYSRRLRLPHPFVQENREFLPEAAKLRTSSGETWDVKLDEQTYDDDEKYLCFIGGGWRKFVRDLGLELGEFLVFWFNVGDSTFDVSVYGTSCCQREIPAMEEAFDFSSEGVMNTRRSKGGNSGGHLYTEIVLKPHHRSLLSFSRKSGVGTGLMRKEAVKVKYIPRKRYGCVTVFDRPKFYRVDLGRGWNAFRKQNGLVYGKTYSFELKPSKNVIYVDEVKKRN